MSRDLNRYLLNKDTKWSINAKKKKAQNHYLSERGKLQTSYDVSLHLLKWLLAKSGYFGIGKYVEKLKFLCTVVTRYSCYGNCIAIPSENAAIK